MRIIFSTLFFLIGATAIAQEILPQVFWLECGSNIVIEIDRQNGYAHIKSPLVRDSAICVDNADQISFGICDESKRLGKLTYFNKWTGQFIDSVGRIFDCSVPSETPLPAYN